MRQKKTFRNSLSHLSIPVKAGRVLNVILIALLLIGIRVWHLAVIQHDERLEEARRPQKRVVIEPAKRGSIRDRFNIPLAMNRVQYNAAVLYSQIKQIPSIAWEKENGMRVKKYQRRDYITALSQKIAEELHLDAERIEDEIHSKASLYNHIPYVIKKELSETEYYRLKMLEKDWAGIHVQRIPKRFYPYGKVAGDLIGYTGAISRREYEAVVTEIQTLENCLKEIENGEESFLLKEGQSIEEAKSRLKDLVELTYSIKDEVGKTGIESRFEHFLRGYHGKKSYTSNAQGNFLKELPEGKTPQSGGRILLSISQELQEFSENLLIQNEEIRSPRTSGLQKEDKKKVAQKEPWIKGGAIVAMDPFSGDILALASCPRFDPNDFIISGDHEEGRRKNAAIHKWFESEDYLADLWDQKRPLEKERYDLQEGHIVEEKKWIDWETYLDCVLAKESPVREGLEKVVNVQNACFLLKRFDSLFSLVDGMELSTAYPLMNCLFQGGGHQFHGARLSTLLQENLEAALQQNKEQVFLFKQSFSPFFGAMVHNYDKVFFLDLMRLAVDPEQISEELLGWMGRQTLGEYRAAQAAKAVVEEEVHRIVRGLFKEYHFKPWRHENQKSFLKEKRIEEKASGVRYPKPYLDLLDKEEKEMFEVFWQSYRFPLMTTFLTGEVVQEMVDTNNLKNWEFGKEAPQNFCLERATIAERQGASEDRNFEAKPTSPKTNSSGCLCLDPSLAPYFQECLIWHRELHQGAYQALSWHPSYQKLRKAIGGIPVRLVPSYLASMRRFSDLNRPLLGKYRSLRGNPRKQLEKDLAGGFYPRYGYGFARSYAYRQTGIHGSLFKLVTAYEALVQRYQKMDPKSDLNPLVIEDDIYQKGRAVFLGKDALGKPIPQLYKGGRIPRSHRSGLGKMDLVKALEVSSNPYFSLLAGDHLEHPEDLSEAAKRFGYGSRTGIDLPAEIAGNVPSDLSCNRNGLYAMAIGQHSLIATPLQMAVMLSAIANGGKVLKPRIVHLMEEKEGLAADGIIERAKLPKGGDLESVPIVHREQSVKSSLPCFSYVPEQVRWEILMPDSVRSLLIEGLHRMMKRTHFSAIWELSKLYLEYPEAISDFLEFKDQCIGKSSTAESIESVDLDLKLGTVLYNHVGFGGIIYERDKKGEERFVFKDRFGKPELVVIVYARYGGWGKDVAPLAMQVAKKWRSIKESYSNGSR